MILVDTSIWIAHLRVGSPTLASLLAAGTVLTHRYVIGELACGNLRNRQSILDHLAALPQAEEADHEEVMAFIEKTRLYGQGIGWVDAHLLASAVLTGCDLWSANKPVRAALSDLGLSSPF